MPLLFFRAALSFEDKSLLVRRRLCSKTPRSLRNDEDRGPRLGTWRSISNLRKQDVSAFGHGQGHGRQCSVAQLRVDIGMNLAKTQRTFISAPSTLAAVYLLSMATIDPTLVQPPVVPVAQRPGPLPHAATVRGCVIRIDMFIVQHERETYIGIRDTFDIQGMG